MVLTRADLGHAQGIVDLIDLWYADKRLLRRTLDDVMQSIASFVVATEGDKVVGCASLFHYHKDLSEVRSLGVHPDFQGKGLGRKLVEECITEAKRLKVERVFALTLEVPFFERLGFKTSEKTLLPEKIWRDCIGCARFPACDEVAVIRNVRD
ncbi:MAG: N-acetyltransferase [Spirochaetia bacterium]|nr:N-acetyltransferase [Spirochaetia bacterium]